MEIKIFCQLHESEGNWKGSEESRLPAEMLALEGVLESCFMIKSLLCEVSNKEMHPDIFPIYYYTDNKLSCSNG